MSQAKYRVIDRNAKGEIIYEGYFCAEHWETERPHLLDELEVTELPADTSAVCTFANLATEFRWAGWKNCAAVMMVLLLPALAEAQTAPIILGNLSDAISTELAVSRAGVAEGNPIVGQHIAQRLVVKAAGTAVQVWAVKQLVQRGKPRLAKVVGYSIAALYGGVTIHNVRVWRR